MKRVNPPGFSRLDLRVGPLGGFFWFLVGGFLAVWFALALGRFGPRTALYGRYARRKCGRRAWAHRPSFARAASRGPARRGAKGEFSV